ncbi:protein TEX261-like isoform X2 [Corticium candelabrum]|uniref:protein TEX261-like isoform X2 n=1 Tax=Corticium candelabrum TaxID=121492 RepID=UPI002E258005|nr:protein TEX261-like isoform X2 [Corticium candelabrum]
MFLWVLSWFACAIQLGFGILCVAAGLYYLAELVEEYTVIARKIITLIVWVVAVVHVCIWLWEDIPAFVIGTGFLANATCALLLKNFPFVSLSSTRFLSAIVMLSVNHYVAFQFFTTVYYPFSEILAYFTVCLWLVPFTYFVSLSANENVLPTTTPIVTVHII